MKKYILGAIFGCAIALTLTTFASNSYSEKITTTSSSLPKIDRLTLNEINTRIKSLGDINTPNSLIAASFDSIVVYKIRKMLDPSLDITSDLTYSETRLVNFETELIDLQARKTALTN